MSTRSKILELLNKFNVPFTATPTIGGITNLFYSYTPRGGLWVNIPLSTKSHLVEDGDVEEAPCVIEVYQRTSGADDIIVADAKVGDVYPLTSLTFFGERFDFGQPDLTNLETLLSGKPVKINDICRTTKGLTIDEHCWIEVCLAL